MRNSATQRLINQFVFARRADKMAARICRAIRKDPYLRDLGIRFLASGTDLELEEQVGMEVYSTTLGGQIDPCRITNRVARADRDRVGFHVEEFEEKTWPKARWATLERLGAAQFKQAIKTRVDVLASHVDGFEPADGTFRSQALNRRLIRSCVQFAVWLDERDVRCWIDDSSPYVHVQMSIPFAGLVEVPHVASQPAEL